MCSALIRYANNVPGWPRTTPQRLDYGTGLYSARSSRQLYDVLAGLAANALRRGDSVIVDAAFSKQVDRQRMAALAQEVGADFLLLDCVASVEECRPGYSFSPK